jgi:hypothetical protein
MTMDRTLDTTSAGIKGFLLGVGLGAVVGLVFHSAVTRPASAADASRDKVQIASEDSFPASDAPAY